MPTCDCWIVQWRRQEANKKARKEAEKEKKKQAADAKRAAVGEMLQNMTEEERKQWHQEQQVRCFTSHTVISDV